MKQYIFLFVILISLLFTVSAKAEKMNFWPLSETTPSHVYALWYNINNLLLDAAPTDNLKKEMSSIDIPLSTVKTPRDVLKHVNELRVMLDHVRVENNLSTTSVVIDRKNQAMAPSMVFLNSLLVLDSFQEWEKETLKGNMEYSKYSQLTIVEGKKPGDVYGLVHLATERLRVLLRVDEMATASK